MLIARPKGDPSRRPKLLALVFGVILVLVGVTASALAALASAHLSSATLTTVVSYDAKVVGNFVTSELRASDLDPARTNDQRVAHLSEQLASLTNEGGILRIEVRALDGRVLFSDAADVIGSTAGRSSGMTAALAGRAVANVVDDDEAVTAVAASLDATSVVEEYFPILGPGDQPLAIVALWRDADAVMASIEGSRRDVTLLTLAAGILLAGVCFLVFRAAQARLSRQHDQLMEATRRDALTGMLNHGTIVGLLAEEIEAARAGGGRIGIALVDVDNFRLFNDTHGHDAADEVLLRVAELVGGESGDTDRVARYGPDEFLLVRPGAGVAEMEESVSRLRAALAELSVQFGDSEQLPVSVSAGICTYPEHAASVTDLLTEAAVAVGEAKASGGDLVRVARIGEEDRVVSGSFDVLQGLVLAVDTKDRYTKRHSEDVARYAVFLARLTGLDQEMQDSVRLAGLLHDIGKIGIPDSILRKPSKLTADEYGIFNQHVALGDAIVRDVPNVDVVRAGIRHHHERWDGGGYIDGLAGEAIPLVARIISVADAFSAMTTTRPYRKALPVDEAIRRLRDAAGTQLQPELVTAFVEGLETAPDAPMPGEEAPAVWRPELWVA